MQILIIAQGSQAAASAQPPTAITTSSATGNGIVAVGTSAATLITCGIANPSLGLRQQVLATPSTAAINDIVTVTCPFAGLADNTTYNYNVSVTDSNGTQASANLQTFTTLNSPSDDLTADVKPPASIKWKGKTTLLPKTTWALNNGNKITKVKVSVKQVGPFTRGDVVTWKVVTNKKTGKVQIITYGKKSLRLQVTYKASKAGYEPWGEGPYTYVVRRPLL